MFMETIRPDKKMAEGIKADVARRLP